MFQLPELETGNVKEKQTGTWFFLLWLEIKKVSQFIEKILQCLRQMLGLFVNPLRLSSSTGFEGSEYYILSSDPDLKSNPYLAATSKVCSPTFNKHRKVDEAQGNKKRKLDQNPFQRSSSPRVLWISGASLRWAAVSVQRKIFLPFELYFITITPQICKTCARALARSEVCLMRSGVCCLTADVQHLKVSHNPNVKNVRSLQN